MSKDSLRSIAENTDTTTTEQQTDGHDRVVTEEFETRERDEYDGGWSVDH
jgi:hypothetical protein